jgi:hypothetical protein
MVRGWQIPMTCSAPLHRRAHLSLMSTGRLRTG